MADDAEAPAWVARKLLRAARAATLASTAEGQPFASLVTPASAADLSVLLLLSDLSEHTRHLRADPRCAILVVGAATDQNLQTAPRVTVTGLAETIDDAGLKRRWLAVHPYGALYAEFGDFHLWRIRPRAALFVGGFARANRLKQADLTPDPAAVAALAAAEADILAHCNADHAEAMTTLAHSVGGSGDGFRMVGADVDGCDLGREEQVVRVPWSAPVADGDGVRKELILALRRIRAG